MIFKPQLSNNSIILKIPFWKLNAIHNSFQFYDLVLLASIPREITRRVDYWGTGSSWSNRPWGGSWGWLFWELLALMELPGVKHGYLVKHAQQMTTHQMPDNFVKFLTFLQNAPWKSKILREILLYNLFQLVLKDCASALHIK